MIKILPIKKIPIIKEGDNVANIILSACDKEKIDLREKDILVIAQTIISKSEGRVVDIRDIKPSQFALNLSKRINKEPELVEVILRESNSIVKIGNGKIITESQLGFICADAGVDHSNSPNDTVTLLPLDPDRSARKIRKIIEQEKAIRIAVIITDTHGRAFREGAINVAIGLSGIEPILDYRGKKDIFESVLMSTKISIADELASAAELLMGEANEKIPATIIRGYEFKISEESRLSQKLIRDHKRDLFR
ncbi:MAG: coenzyme F420-0:L-glutamate ligase [Candidatus Lokiarchaeota archaeon]|nr:coenzyme F420-0:L-glutamate ligase [Candidatus Lokiarchaeota archaeon]